MTALPPTIAKARARLLVRAPFFGSIALGLTWISAPEIGTMATDGRHVWFSPDWCEHHGVENIMGVIAHEVLHVVNKHHLRRGVRDPDLWNRAADLMVNRILESDHFALPQDGLFDREGRFAGLPVETIYARLLETQQSGARQPYLLARALTEPAGRASRDPGILHAYDMSYRLHIDADLPDTLPP